MNKKKFLSLLLVVAILSVACSKQEIEDDDIELVTEQESAEQETSEVETEEEVQEEEAQEEEAEETSDIDDLLDQVVAGELIINDDREFATRDPFYFTDLPNDPEDWESYSVGDRADVDNDGENELLVNGPYGGMYIDVRDGQAYVLAEGEGTAGELTYASYRGVTYICHLDISHGGREVFMMDEYNGDGEIVNSTSLMAEFWELGYYDETATCHFGDEEITTQQYEKLRNEIFGW
jgi:hypothetical protein